MSKRGKKYISGKTIQYKTKAQIKKWSQNAKRRHKAGIFDPKPIKDGFKAKELLNLLTKEEERIYEAYSESNIKAEHPKYVKLLNAYRKDVVIANADEIRLIAGGAPVETDIHGNDVKNELLLPIELGYGFKYTIVGYGIDENAKDFQKLSEIKKEGLIKGKNLKWSWIQKLQKLTKKRYGAKIRLIRAWIDGRSPLLFPYTESYIHYVVLLNGGTKITGISFCNLLRAVSPNCVIDLLWCVRNGSISDLKEKLDINGFAFDKIIAEWTVPAPAMLLIRVKPKPDSN